MAEQMKPSGIDWIGEIPCSWNIKRIKYLAQLKGRIGWQGLTSDEYTDVGPFLITGVDFSNGGINWENCVHITEERWAEAPEIHIKNGDLLITKDGTVGKVAIVENLQGKASLNSGVLLIKTSNDYNKKFLYWALLSEEFWTWFRLKNAGNSTIVHLYQNDFAEFSYTFPDATEQQAIADFLDKECAQIDSIAADLEKQIALLQQYKKSLITETVTKGLDKSVPMKDSGVEFFGKIPAHWKVSKTKYVADISIGLVTTMTANYVDEDGVPLIRNSNIRTNHIDDNGMVYLSKEFAKANIGRALHKGDIVTVHTGDVGTSAIINETYHMSHGFATIISRLKTKTVNNQFLCWLYNSEIFKEMSIAYSTGDGRQNLNLYDFVDFYILIPTLKEQMEIVNWLNLKSTEIDNFIENKQQQLLLIQQHKKSLIYEYVTGKKRVKEVQ